MQPRVFVPHMPTRLDAATGTHVPVVNVNQASRFGKLFTLSQGAQWPQNAQALKEAMRTFRPDDYILCIGDVAALSIAICYASKQVPVVSLLKWDRQEHKYYEQEVCL